MARPRKTANKKSSQTYSQRSYAYFEKLEEDIRANNSTVSLILGALIIIVAAILLFNYFQKPQSEVGPSSQTQADVAPGNLPGKYTVKTDDTLFTIAQHYYNNGYKYPDIAKANKLSDVNVIFIGQILEIPKLGETAPTPTPAPTTQEKIGTPHDSVWGPAITGTIYIVKVDDWLSKIADRAYGDIYAYPKIAKANNIVNPDLIFPGQVLKIPR